MRTQLWRLSMLLATGTLILSACTGGATSPPPDATDGGAADGEVVDIRWFCCLGAGDAPAQVEVEQRIVDEFNASHPNINLTLEVVEYEEAYDTLAVQLTSPDPPDLVGPAGFSGGEAFDGQWLDLNPLVESTGFDMSQFSEDSIALYQDEEDGLVGIPFAIFPSMLYYQRDMFDEAGLEYPPHQYGEPYMLDGEEVEWNMDTLRELALRLTVDVNNNDATSPDFDPENIVQWGYEPQYQDLRAVGSYFGSGALVAEDRETAQVPEEWQEAWRRYYDAVWTDHTTMNLAQRDSPEIGNENPFQAGNVAMALSHLWYQCCATPTDPDSGEFLEEPNWDIAAVPSHNGVTTANMNADTWRILEATDHPEEAFEVLTYLLGEARPELLELYGGFPAVEAEQDTFFDGMEEKWPQDVDWQVALDGIPLADSPSFEGWTPNYQEAFDAVLNFGDKLRSTEGLDVDAEIEAFIEELQSIYDRAE